ncbi:dna mismatch repair protein msh3 [Phaffia rhodozyma]|uniref:DNA mismatch repair protein MSH3 n=1 Tax=Phaffia rhodozyma TaxID=264483 RepID=A0A0F7SFP8_PHARH|nr:dna mismatch repair protein msh3 [Phaffia rhodozyma]
MTPKNLSPPTNQPSVSSFFKRKSPPSSQAWSESFPSKKPRVLANDQSLKQADATSANPIEIEDSPSPSANDSSSSVSYIPPPPSTTVAFRPPSRAPSVVPLYPKAGTTASAKERLRKLAYVEESESVRKSETVITNIDKKEREEEEDTSKKIRHELFKSRLLGVDFGRRRSLDLENAQDAAISAADPGSDQNGEAVEEGQPTSSASKMQSLKQKLSARGVAKGAGKAKEMLGPSGKSYTPLEKQILDLKEKYPGILLIIEVGYKFRFFGEDAKIASRYLNIVAFPDRNFMTASIPIHRVDIHVKNLITHGYKVGVCRQIETAALKKSGDNRNTPFIREMKELYTATTFVDELSSFDSTSEFERAAAVPPSNALFILAKCTESDRGEKLSETNKQMMGMVSVVPSTGDVIWDEWEVGSRGDLETRLTHINPQEFLLPTSRLSKETEGLLTDVAERGNIRLERYQDDMSFDKAQIYLSSFHSGEGKNKAVFSTLTDFPKAVVLALAYAVRYLEDFNLSSSLLHTETSFTRFTGLSHMLLNANTLNNLEVYRNSDDGGEKGSLFWLLNHCVTRFGSRLLRQWVGRPLINQTILQARVDAVEELLTDTDGRVEKLIDLLKGLYDLPRGLARIQYGKSSPKELVTLLIQFRRLGSSYSSVSSFTFESDILRSIVSSLAGILEPVEELLKEIYEKAAREGEIDSLWKDENKFPEIAETKALIDKCDRDLFTVLSEIRILLKRPKLEFSTVSNINNLIEVRQTDAKKVPKNWIKISSTKLVVRFHTPEILKILREKEQYKETLVSVSASSFRAFLREVNEFYDIFRSVTHHLATLDCLLSLAKTANQPGYTKPVLVDEPNLDVKGGFHPVLAALSDETYVPNDLVMSAKNGRSKIITGPNMGGKSSLVRMVCLIVLMAQIGSYVPASAVTMGIHDAIHTRMGASDDITGGQSTFMVELSETSEIIHSATDRSLIVLDELGRGTSTFDGMALAEAVLYHLVTKTRSNNLFITHYPLVATSLAKQLEDVSNWHMGFRQIPRPDGSHEITFLYRLSPGLARASFGVECARLAGLPDEVLRVADKQSRLLEESVRLKIDRSRVRHMKTFIRVALNYKNEKEREEKRVEHAGLQAGRALLNFEQL